MNTKQTHDTTQEEDFKMLKTSERKLLLFLRLAENDEGITKYILSELEPTEFCCEIHQKLFCKMKEYHEAELPVKVCMAEYLKELETSRCSEEERNLVEVLTVPTNSKNTNIEKRNVKPFINHIKAASDLREVKGAMDGFAENVDLPKLYKELDKFIKDISTIAGTQKGNSLFSHEYVHEVQKIFDDRYQNKERPFCVQTGFKDLDSIITGLKKSSLTIIAGRTSMGKTSFALSLILNVSNSFAEENKDEVSWICIFSLEVPAEDLWTKLISTKTGYSFNKVEAADVSQEEYAKVHETIKVLGKANLIVHDESQTVSSITEIVRGLSLKTIKMNGKIVSCKPKLIIIDYLQLIGSDDCKPGGNRTNEVSEMTAKIKALAKDLKIPIVLLSQLSRASELREDRRPQLSDLRDSGSIEQDADLVMLLYRAEYYLSRQKPTRSVSQEEINFALSESRNKAEIIVAKNRNGPTGTVELRFNHENAGFSDLCNKQQY